MEVLTATHVSDGNRSPEHQAEPNTSTRRACERIFPCAERTWDHQVSNLGSSCCEAGKERVRLIYIDLRR